jgi:hypothetical protein
MPTGKTYIDRDPGWLSNIFGAFTRADSANAQAVERLSQRAIPTGQLGSPKGLLIANFPR